MLGKWLAGLFVTAMLVGNSPLAMADNETNSLMLHISNLTTHELDYTATITPGEEALHSSPLNGTIPKEQTGTIQNYAGMFIFRKDNQDYVVKLRITNPEMNEVIWEGKIIGDARTHETKTVVKVADSKHYKLHIMLSQSGEPMPSFSIGVLNKG